MTGKNREAFGKSQSGTFGAPLFVVVFVVVTAVFLLLLDIRTSWDSSVLTLAVNIVLVVTPSFFIAVAASWGFLRSGSWQVMLLGTGTLSYGLAVLLSMWIRTWASNNASRTVFAISYFMAGLLYVLSGFAASRKGAQRAQGEGRLAVVVSVYLAVLACIGCTAVLSVHELLPPFSTQAVPSTPLRIVIQGVAILFFIVASFTIFMQSLKSNSAFLRWYALGLLLTVVNTVGTLVATVNGSPFHWTLRAAQLLGGTYLLIAAATIMREARIGNMNTGEAIDSLLKQAHAMLRATEEKYTFVFNNVPFPISLARMNDFTLVDVNQAWVETFGIARSKAIGKSPAELSTGIIPEQWPTFHLELRGNGSMQNVEVTDYCTRNKRERVFLTNWVAMEFGGGSYIFTSFQDITERKKAEQELKERTIELEAANKELETFAYSVSHDLRAPLRGIDGFSMVLLEDHADKLDEQGKEYLNMVRAAAKRMGSLIDGILRLSRSSRSALRREEFDISMVAGKIAAELQKTAPDRRVEFLIRPGIIANADRVLMESAMENLLNNAWKFTSKHSLAKIEFGLAEQEDGLVYYVRDDGAGLDTTCIHKLFAPFQRLHSGGDFPGNGIGLATVQRIIQRHGGRIWAEGAVERGATFYFTLGGA